jgi:hypothetical protein
MTGQPGTPVCALNSFFVNANLIPGMNGIAGLQIAEARQFQQAPGSSQCSQNPLAVLPAEYRELLVRSEQSLDGEQRGMSHSLASRPSRAPLTTTWSTF